MQRCASEPLERPVVCPGRIPDVGFPFVLGEIDVVSLHQAVSLHLGDDGGGCDRLALAVATYDRLNGPVRIRKRMIAVNQNEGGLRLERFDGSSHGFHGGPQDVQFVDFSRRADSDSDGYGLCSDPSCDPGTLGWSQYLAILDAAEPVFLTKHNGGGHDRTRQAAPSRFVDPCDQTVSVRPESTLYSKTRHGKGGTGVRRPRRTDREDRFRIARRRQLKDIR